MRALVTCCCFVALLVLGIAPAQAEGTTRVDLVVRELPASAPLELHADADADEGADSSASEEEARPAKAQPLRVRLDSDGRFELLLRVSRSQFLGKLALAL